MADTNNNGNNKCFASIFRFLFLSDEIPQEIMRKILSYLNYLRVPLISFRQVHWITNYYFSNYNHQINGFPYLIL